jgi:hypothetical protein
MTRSLDSLRTAIDTSALIPSISIKGDKFTAVDPATKLKEEISLYDPDTKSFYIEAIIVDINDKMSKVYYEGAYNPGEVTAPTCMSDNGIGASVHANKPQSMFCATCRHNDWGSKVYDNGKKGKACRDFKKLALLIPDYNQQLLFRLMVPPASLTYLSLYHRQLGLCKIDGQGALPIEVMTRISFDKEQLHVLTFEIARKLRRESEEGQKLYEMAVSHFEEGTSISLVGLDDRPVENVAAPKMLAAPPARLQLAAPLPNNHTPAPDAAMERDRQHLAQMSGAADNDGATDVPWEEVNSLPKRG